MGLARRARNSTGDGSQKVPCSSCHLRAGCLPAGLSPEELEQVDGRLVSWRRKVARGEALFRAGDRFDAVFAVWSGFFKTVISSTQGCEQVTGFRMAGEVIGLDGIETGRHRVDAVALEHSQVCVVLFSELEALEREVPSLQRQFHKIMSQRIAFGYDGQCSSLGTAPYAPRSKSRNALLELAIDWKRTASRRPSVVVRTGPVELGGFLGLTFETVSRTLTKFQTSSCESCSKADQIPPDLPACSN